MVQISGLAASSLGKALVGVLVILGWEPGVAEQLASVLGTNVESAWGIILIIWGGADAFGNKNRKQGGMRSLLHYRE